MTVSSLSYFRVEAVRRANFRKGIESAKITGKMEILRLRPISGRGKVKEFRAIAGVGEVVVGDKVTIIGKHQQYPSYWKVRTVER